MRASKQLTTTVRPRALSLGVLLPEPEELASLVGVLAPQEIEALRFAMLEDTIYLLRTFPVKHRFVLSRPNEQLRCPPGFKQAHVDGPSIVARRKVGLEALLGASRTEAAMILCAKAHPLPIGELFDGMLWLLSPGRVLLGVGAGEPDAPLYALGVSGEGELPPLDAQLDDVTSRASFGEAWAHRGGALETVRGAIVPTGEASLRAMAVALKDSHQSPACQALFAPGGLLTRFTAGT